MECELQVWSAGCEERSAKCEENVQLALHCTGARAGHVLGQQRSSLEKTRGPGWRTAHASSIDEKGLIV